MTGGQHLCIRYVEVAKSPQGTWRARLTCKVKGKHYLSGAMPSRSDAVADAYRAAGIIGYGLPVFDV